MRLPSPLLALGLIILPTGLGCENASHIEARTTASVPTYTSPEPAPAESWRFTDCSDARETNHTLIFSDSALSALAAGDTLFVFSEDGLCVGKSDAFSGKNFAMAAWGDDSATETRDGLAPGEPFHLILKSSRFPEPVKLASTEMEGPVQYQPNGITIIRGLRPE